MITESIVEFSNFDVKSCILGIGTDLCSFITFNGFFRSEDMLADYSDCKATPTCSSLSSTWL